MEQKIQGDGDFSAVLGNILSNPDMMSTIKNLAEQLKSDSPPVDVTATNTESTTEEPTPPQSPKMPDAISALAPLLSTDFSKLSREDDRRSCLLRALKPYLSEGRCEAIEYIIKFSAISGIIKNLS